MLGFEETYRRPGAVFMSAGGYHHHIALNTWESRGGQPPAPGTTGLYHIAIVYPTRRLLADALRRLIDAGIQLDGASDHGVSEALYFAISTTMAWSLLGSAPRAMAAGCRWRHQDENRPAKLPGSARGVAEEGIKPPFLFVLSAALVRCRHRAARHHADQMRTIFRRTVNVAVDAVG